MKQSLKNDADILSYSLLAKATFFLIFSCKMKPQKGTTKQPFFCSRWKRTILNTQERFLPNKNYINERFSLTVLVLIEVVKRTVILWMACTVTNVHSNGKVFLSIARNSCAICFVNLVYYTTKAPPYAMLAFNMDTFVWLPLRSGITSKLDESVEFFFTNC